MEGVGPDRHEEAREVLALGRISWRLRDNDNLLLARVESQLLRAIHAAAGRLERAGRLKPHAGVNENAAALNPSNVRSIVAQAGPAGKAA
jgi:hypothetical protein